MIDMEEIAISEFKAKCLGLIDQVKKTRKPLRITKRGEVMAELYPPAQVMSRMEWIESMQGSGETLGDIISPASDPEDWEVLRD